MGLRNYMKKRKQEAAERAGYRRIVAKRTTQAARQAYADEAEKVAREKARAKARRRSFGELLTERVRGGAERKISGTPTKTIVRRTVPRRRTVRRVTRAAPRRRYAPVRRVAPRRRVVRRDPVRRQPASQPTSFNVSDLI